MKVMIIGSSSEISNRLAEQLHAAGHSCTRVGRHGPDQVFDANAPSQAAIEALVAAPQDVYVINLGLLQPKRISEQTLAEMQQSMHVNMLSCVRLCEAIFAAQQRVKVFIIGSESATKGSFDTSYFLAKAGVKAYVRERYLHHPQQQLLLFSPSTIGDAGMTTRRADQQRLAQYQAQHPKQRFMNSAEVARILLHCMSDDFNYMNNAELELNGGKFARMQ
jgi:NAD(P)-dependent dehydrogenase (short-subunit alcohol dehydrogenase family)